MGELRNSRRRSFPSCFDRTDVGSSLKAELSVPAAATKKTYKTRWSIGDSGGRGIPDLVRVTQHNVGAASGRLEDARKRTCTDETSDSPDVPSKRLTRVSSSSSAWNCSGLTWTGLRRRLGVLRRSCRVPERRCDLQPPPNTGNICLPPCTTV